MKRKIIIGLCCLFTINSFSQNSQKDYCAYQHKNFQLEYPNENEYDGITSGWKAYPKMTFEFDSDIDYNKWQAKDDYCHPMSQAAYFRKTIDNIKVVDGKLKLSVVDEGSNYKTCTFNEDGQYVDYDLFYSSGYVKTQNSFSIQYGYIEMKCYIPHSVALNPCFWLCASPPEAYDEIDVFERHADGLHFDEPDNTFMCNFYHNLDRPGISQLRQDMIFDEPFVGRTSVFAVEWLPHEIHYYLNGKLINSIKYNEPYYGHGGQYSCVDFEDAVPMQIQVSLAVNSMIDGEDFNNLESFEIDYIRSYKLEKGYNSVYWPNNFSLSNSNLFKVHRILKLGGENHTAVIPQNENITVWASESIVLDEGFELPSNTKFAARVINVDSDSRLYEQNAPGYDNGSGSIGKKK